MTPKNKFTKAQERKILAVGKRIENARLAARLSIRGAAEMTRTPRGHLTEFTWRRVERGTIQTGLGEVLYRPSPSTLMAMAEVVGLDGAELCKELDLVPPPPATPRKTMPSLSGSDRLRELLEEALEILSR